MDPHSQPQLPEAQKVLPARCNDDAVWLRFAPQFAGATGIVAGLRSLALGKSIRETWLIAREARGEQPQQILGRCIVARPTLDGWTSWRYCDADGDPFGEESRPLVPEQEHQDQDHHACAQLAAHLFQLAQQYQADVFRLDPDAAVTLNAPVLPWPPRTWHRICTRDRKSESITTDNLRELLCRELKLTPEAADRQIEAHARSSGLIRIGEDWYHSESRRLLPPLPREDYQRVVRALENHRKDCENDRLSHAKRGNHGAARALASEEAATVRTMELITSLTQEFP